MNHAKRDGCERKPQDIPVHGGNRCFWGASTEDGVLVTDETGFLKKGQASCGVGWQYTGSVGKITNCQIGVFATSISAQGHAFVDRTLCLPKDWTSNRERLKQANVSDDVVFTTKPAFASIMIERSIETLPVLRHGVQKEQPCRNS